MITIDLSDALRETIRREVDEAINTKNLASRGWIKALLQDASSPSLTNRVMSLEAQVRKLFARTEVLTTQLFPDKTFETPKDGYERLTGEILVTLRKLVSKIERS